MRGLALTKAVGACLQLQTGTDGQWWLDWDREYAAWKAAALPVTVSYQFSAHDQPPSTWPDAYTTSYTLGYKFARHFGSTSGTGNVGAFEAGNEPCKAKAVRRPCLHGLIVFY